MPLRNEAADIAGEIAELRHAIHAEPEIGLDLPKTQQKVLDADPSFKLKAIAADAPLSHLRWLIEKRFKEESTGIRDGAVR